jgi:membrane-bound lytic murein transglycosylase A
MPLSPRLVSVSFDDMPGWAEDRPAEAFTAFRRSARHALATPYRTGSLGIDAVSFATAQQDSLTLGELDHTAARAFFEARFAPFRVLPDEGTKGLVTGFYEPEVDASPLPTDRFGVPLLAPPDDLVKVDDTNRPVGFDPYLAFGRSQGDGIVEYHDRAAIESGVLGDRTRAIAWVEHKVDAFFIHVQGAARLRMPGGVTKRVTYAAKSGQRFTGPGRVLADLGEIPLEQVTMQSIRAWFRANPNRIDEILHRNRSYIFFREASVDDPLLGPVAAAKVPLTAGRSIAVDRLLHTFGTPVFVSAPTLVAFGGRFQRLMVAQDTGSAIVGAARGDFFAGSGDAAGEIAGVVRNDADFFVLVPRGLAEAARR